MQEKAGEDERKDYNSCPSKKGQGVKTWFRPKAGTGKGRRKLLGGGKRKFVFPASQPGGIRGKNHRTVKTAGQNTTIRWKAGGEGGGNTGIGVH